MKIEEKQNPSIFLATYWNLALKSGDLGEKKNSSKSGKFGLFFFHQKHPLFRLKSYFSG
jgi:hypothetical protein